MSNRRPPTATVAWPPRQTRPVSCVPGSTRIGASAASEDDAAVVQVPGGGRAGSDAPGSALPGRGVANDAGAGIDGGQTHRVSFRLMSGRAIWTVHINLIAYYRLARRASVIGSEEATGRPIALTFCRFWRRTGRPRAAERPARPAASGLTTWAILAHCRRSSSALFTRTEYAAAPRGLIQVSRQHGGDAPVETPAPGRRI